MNNEVVDQLQTALGGKVTQDKVLTPYITLRTDAVAQYFFTAISKEDLIQAKAITQKLNIPFLILGGGSNVAITTPRIEGLVVRNVYQKKELVTQTDEYVDLLVSSGYAMARLVKETAEAGYSGFEYHKGLPGSVGGAMYMNSKWMHPETYCGDSLLEAELLTDDGTVKKVTRDYFNFAYDYSILQETHEVFLEGIYRLKKMDPQILIKRSQEANEYRERTQPVGVATSGCFFRNISKEEQESHNLPYTSAGYLIDKAGMKGHTVGGFVVSDIHANFIVNTGGGTVNDMNTIVSDVKKKIQEQYGITLHEEVVVI